MPSSQTLDPLPYMFDRGEYITYGLTVGVVTDQHSLVSSPARYAHAQKKNKKKQCGAPSSNTWTIQIA